MTTRERSVPFAEYDNTDTHKKKKEWNWEFCGRVIGQLLPTIEEKGFTHFQVHFSLLFLFHYYYCNALFHSARVRRDIKCLLFIQFPLELKETKKRIPSLFLVSGIRKKKNYFNNLFLSSFLYTLGSLPDERIRHNKHTRAIFLDIRIFNLPLPLVCNNLTQRKQNKLKENKEKKSSQCEWIQH